MNVTFEWWPFTDKLNHLKRWPFHHMTSSGILPILNETPVRFFAIETQHVNRRKKIFCICFGSANAFRLYCQSHLNVFKIHFLIFDWAPFFKLILFHSVIIIFILFCVGKFSLSIDAMRRYDVHEIEIILNSKSTLTPHLTYTYTHWTVITTTIEKKW